MEQSTDRQLNKKKAKRGNGARKSRNGLINKAVYTATYVACDWAGAVTK